MLADPAHSSLADSDNHEGLKPGFVTPTIGKGVPRQTNW